MQIKETSVLLILIVCFLAGKTALAGNVTGVTVYESKVQVNVKDKSLCTLLRELSNPASFTCPSSVQRVRISTRFQASDRFAALWRLLREYSIIGVWDEGGNLSTVYFLGTDGETAFPEDTPSPGMDLSVSELRKLGRLTFKKPLPENVFRSPAYQPLFRLAGIHSPQDWLTITKALQVKRHIRRIIKLKTNR
ncbi:MAG: hypothetical protein ACE5G9_05395 [Nitrospinales bacterium]